MSIEQKKEQGEKQQAEQLNLERETLRKRYQVEGLDEVITPGLIYYEDLVRANTEEVIRLAGGVKRLWPHVKTFKMRAVTELLISYGITKFKTATIAEAEMCAMSGAKDVLVAYPLVGPNVERFVSLQEAYPNTRFWAVADRKENLEKLAAEAKGKGQQVPTLLDINIGMNRTGVEIEEAQKTYEEFSKIEGIKLCGLHAFSGNFKITDTKKRQESVDETAPKVMALRESLRKKGYACDVLIFGSTPSLPCYLEYEDTFLSPGTAFITDIGYQEKFPDLSFVPAGAVISRVISSTKEGDFTLDCGYKSIAADPPGSRGLILGYEEAQQRFQCEEHWAFRMPQGKKGPKVGELVYILPTHICPTTALYPYAHVAKEGRVIGTWLVTARNRRITI